MRDRILRILMNTDNFLSGESISISLGITRAAVWKHIKSLKQDGFEIESKPRLGYRLKAFPGTLDEVTLLEVMETKVMGKKLEVHEILDSTNNRAREVALRGAPEGTLIIAESQSMGRGRLGRNWASPKGKGIWMSLILRPNIPPDQASRITAIGAVAIRRALNKATDLDIGIKWPNDIIIEDKKVCGILTEMHGDIDRIYYVVLGIGININLVRDDFPPEIRSTATSLSIAMNRILNRRKIIALVMKEIEKLYFKYVRDNDFQCILDECRKYSLTLGKKVRVVGRETAFEGFALDFDTDGSLLVKMDDGSIKKVMSGDVSVRGVKGYV